MEVIVIITRFIRSGSILILCSLVLLVSCQTKPKEETTPPPTTETPTTPTTPPGTAVGPSVKQFKENPSKEIPAFSGKELLDLPTDKWITNGGNLYNQRYSPLDKINTSNVAQLKGEWTAKLGSGLDFKFSGEATPIVYDGVMYIITGANDVLALDAKTGEAIWEYRANLDESITTVCCGWTSRGVAVGEGKVFVGRLDAKLVALDQKTGEVIWEAIVDQWETGHTITNAPLYYNGKVYTGISGGEYGIRGYVAAYDAKLGRELWRFYTIPGPGEVGHDTWPQDNDSWKIGGAPVWQTPAVDPDLGLLYFSTGNAAPDVDGSKREGDNLFASSIVAIDAETGKYKWHFQEVHHDIWDYDAPNPVILFDVNINGTLRKGLGQAGKTGWVYLLDRTDGTPLVGITEKPVPQNENQKTAATQPFPEGDAIIPQSIPDEVMQKDFPNYKGKSGDIFTPFWDDPVLIKPYPLGGANWPPSAYSPDTEYFYVLAQDGAFVFTRNQDEEYNPGNVREGKSFIGSSMRPAEGGPPVRSHITAIDVKTNKIAWQEKWDTTAYSGALVTKGGLLFVGHNDGRLIAFDAKTGDQLWEFLMDAGANAPAMTYEIDGVQYITIHAGGSSLAGSKHGDTLWTFSLNGKIEPTKK